MSPKYVDKQQRARDISHAALQVFSQKGYTAASVDQIAAAAGIAKGTVYEYFPSKDRLYMAAIMVFADEYEAAMAERLGSLEDPFQRLIGYIGFSIKFCMQENPATVRTLFDILQQSILENGVFAKRKYLIREMMLGPKRTLTDILLDGVSRGIFYPHIARSAGTLATNIIAYLDGASLHHRITDDYFNTPEQLKHYVRLLADLLLITPNGYDVDELIAQAIGR